MPIKIFCKLGSRTPSVRCLRVMRVGLIHAAAEDKIIVMVEKFVRAGELHLRPELLRVRGRIGGRPVRKGVAEKGNGLTRRVYELVSGAGRGTGGIRARRQTRGARSACAPVRVRYIAAILDAGVVAVDVELIELAEIESCSRATIWARGRSGQ